jgi:TPR repeat protein
MSPKKGGRAESVRRSSLDALYTKAFSQYECGNYRSALHLFLSGAKRGDPSAQNMVGYFYDTGVGIRPNRSTALNWYRRAYRHRSRAAAGNIGTIFRDERNSKRALFWFRRAVQLGDADSNLEIAKLLLSDTGSDVKGAIKHLMRAIKAKPSDVTEDSREQARRLLKRIQQRGTRISGRKRRLAEKG